MKMELNYIIYDDTEYHFKEAIKSAVKDNLGLYYFDGEVYLPNCLHSYYFINVTSYLYEQIYEVYTFGEFLDQDKTKYLIRLPFINENFFKRGWI